MSPSKPTVSVIMPAYNVEAYVARAVESVRAQTLRDLELIVIDDGSIDRTGRIVDRIAERDWRIEVIHTENRGAPAARNLALERARGTWIAFFDADDWAEPTMLADEVGFAEAHDLDLVITGFVIETQWDEEGSRIVEDKTLSSRVFDGPREFRAAAHELFDENLLYTPWNKLFRASRIRELDIRFKDTFWDDFPFVLDYIRDVERVGILEHCYYHFQRTRAESETSKWRPDMYEKREEEHEWMLDLLEHWDLTNDPASWEMVQRRYIERLVGCIENVCEPACTLDPDERKELVRQMISSERAQRAVAEAKPRSTMMRVMLWPIRRQDVALTLNEGRFIAFVKRHNARMFSTLKANR